LLFDIKTVSDPLSPLRLNVGFIVAQSAGFSREFSLEVPRVVLPPDLTLTGLTGSALITRTNQGLLIQVNLRAALELECGRCLTPVIQPLHAHFTELYAFSRRYMTESGLTMPETGIIDLTPVLREYMLLEIPMSPLCRPDCKGLCPVCGNNQNEVTCQHDEEPGDPRLAALKDLLAR
jgi:uncharacterized protein